MKELFNQSSLCEYLILINPTDEIKVEVKGIKRSFFKNHGSYIGQNSDAHISLMSFFQSENREDKLVYGVCEAMRDCEEFDVFLNGFGFFPSNNTFFIDIVNQYLKEDITPFFETHIIDGKLIALNTIFEQKKNDYEIGNIKPGFNRTNSIKHQSG